jgi:hypothetical protein
MTRPQDHKTSVSFYQEGRFQGYVRGVGDMYLLDLVGEEWKSGREFRSDGMNE